MKILSGLFDHMVLQRNTKDTVDAAFEGESSGTGSVTARVTRNGKALPGLDGVVVGRAAEGKIAGKISGVPVGGPYSIELRAKGSASGADDLLLVQDVLVGDVWILAGQSNMQGVGLLKYASPPHDMVRAFYMDDRWAVAMDPVHNLWECVDPVHVDLNNGQPHGKATVAGTGPGVAFAQEMHRLSGGVPQGLLACAHGGTSMAQWDPALKEKGGKSLYGATLRRVHKNGGKVAGVAWYQGESETNGNESLQYIPRMQKLVSEFRKDLGDENLPVVTVQISRVLADWVQSVHWNAVQDAQRRLPKFIPRLATVPAIDLPLDDLIHVGGTGNNRLGRRMGQAMWNIISGEMKPPIELKSISLETDERGGANVVVDFENVEGSLHSGECRPVGFTIADAGPRPVIYNTELQGSRAILHLTLPLNECESIKLHYGYGGDPICNILDSADRSLPVFGPIPMKNLWTVSGFPKSLEISGFQRSAGNLQSLKYPADIQSLQFTRRAFDDRFSSIHPELEALSPTDVVVYYRCPLLCAEKMKIEARLGYDGPVKVWINGTEAFHDPNGTNPATVDHHKIPFEASAGMNEVLIALGSNHGKAWGIFLRFERMDVSKELLEKGPGSFAMPQLG